MDSTTLALLIASFTACFVEMVEAVTIVMAMGFTRGWRSALAGTAAALLALVVFALAVGSALATWLPESLLQLTIGVLLLIFGLQWLRKAVLRSAGWKAMHDEDAAFAEQTAAAAGAAQPRGSLDMFGFMVSFKGVFLEGVEVVFVVLTFGLSTRRMSVAVWGAVAAAAVVLVVAVLLRRPLSMVPENLLKYGVGLLLATFGTFWTMEGLGFITAPRESLEWPGGDLALLAVLVGWLGLSRALISRLRAVEPAVTVS